MKILEIQLANGNIIKIKNSLSTDIEELQKRMLMEGIIKIKTIDGNLLVRSEQIDAVWVYDAKTKSV